MTPWRMLPVLLDALSHYDRGGCFHNLDVPEGLVSVDHLVEEKGLEEQLSGPRGAEDIDRLRPNW